MDHSLGRTKRRMIFWSVVFLSCFGLLGWNCYRIQVSRHGELLRKAQNVYTTEKVLTGQRGEIFDMDGHLLVGNVPKIRITVSPYSAVHEPYSRFEKSRRAGVKESLPRRRNERRQKIAAVLSEVFGSSPGYWYGRLSPFVPRRNAAGKAILDENKRLVMRQNHFLVLDNAADMTVAETLKKKLGEMENERRVLAGFNFANIMVRYYPKKRQLANVLGFSNVVNEKEIGQSGLEKELHDATDPDVGKFIYERARTGEPLVYGIQKMEAGRDGSDIYLTVNEAVQAILEEELDAAYAEWNPDTIYAVVADPSNGNILAIAQRPNFDPNDRKTFTPESMGARIATDIYEPGSIMKPFTVGKALDWGFVRPDDEINTENGTWIYCGRPLKDLSRRPKLTVAGVIQKSSNIGTAKIALKMGNANLDKMFRTFEFGTRSNLPFAGESRGIVPKLAGHRDKLLPTRAPIGYGVSVSALQLTRAYCALANDGMMPQLRIIDRIRKAGEKHADPVPLRPFKKTFENPEALSQLIDMMIKVTSPGGSGTRGAIAGYEVAGKTGTSNKHVSGKGYDTSRAFTSFVGFVPARRPRFVMLVTLDSPRGSRPSGGKCAAPVFSKTMSRVLRVMNVAPDFPDKIK